MKPLSECRYSTFISYAHAADKAHGRWVTQFQTVLSETLQGRIEALPGERRRVPGMHMSGINGPVAGNLGPTLEKSIADSFAMVIVADDAYVNSGWCLNELEYFRSLFGERGFAERLYVIAMTRSGIDALSAKPEWRRLTPSDLVWIPFYDEAAPNSPMRVYLDNEVLTTRFQSQLDRVVNRLVQSILQPPVPTRAAVAPLQRQQDGQAPGPAQQQGPGRVLFGVPAPEFAAKVQSLADQLRTLGTPVQLLGDEALEGDLTEMDNADTLVLSIGTGGGLPAYRNVKGGHLALQRDTWLDKHRPATGLLWLDLRHLPCATPPGKGHQDLLAEVGAQALPPAALLQRLQPPPPVALQPVSAVRAERINIYIESNQHEVDVWDDLGERIKLRWQKLLKQYEPATVPPLYLHARGLPLQRIDDEQLDDADGVVLLWGNKTEESLRAQIRKVESKILGEPPPGIVAYLIPQRDDPQQAIEAKLWNVLRFQDSTSADIDIVPKESERLDKFLYKILNRTAQRKRAVKATLGAR